MSSKLKVLHVLASNKFSGAENVVCQIINMFQNEIDMVYTSPMGEISKALDLREVEYMPMNKLSVKQLKKVICECKPDVIHAHDIKATIVSVLASGKIPVVSQVHGSDSEKMKKTTAKSVLYALACKKAGHIIWVSQSCLDSFRFKKKNIKKSTILYNIISLESLSKKNINKPQNTYDVAYLGRLEPVKNPIRMLEIIKGLVCKNSGIKAVVMGDGSLKNECEKYITENDLENNVELKGFVENPIEILSGCKALLLSSISEGTPMCALEALGIGVPVVSTPTDGLVDIIKDDENGYLYSNNSDAVTYLMKIINGEKNLKDNCIRWSEDFNDLQKYKQTIRKIYESVVE